MTKSLEVNRKEYLPSAVLSKRFGYSPDYISRLAREGKVIATRVGRQWLINEVSLQHFIEDLNTEKTNRSQALRMQRRTELTAHTQQKKTQKKKENHTSHLALAQASIVMGLGLITGLLGWTMVSNDINFSEITSGAGKMYAQIIQSIIPNPMNVTNTAGTSASASIEIETPDIPSFERYTEVSPTVSIDEFRDNPRSFTEFSDEVEVISENEDTRVIRPIFKDGQGNTSYEVPQRPIPPE
ncbi:MAG: virulence-associated protein VagC [Acidimicrobiales bacterium]|jgi:virulence-associated protein VagC